MSLEVREKILLNNDNDALSHKKSPYCYQHGLLRFVNPHQIVAGYYKNSSYQDGKRFTCNVFHFFNLSMALVKRTIIFKTFPFKG